MLTSTQGIILHNTKYSESSIICKIFTKDYGLLSFMINGVRSTKSKDKTGVFQPLQYLDLEIYLRDNKSLLYMKEYKTAMVYTSMPYDLNKRMYGVFILEVLYKTIKVERETASDKYEFIKDSLEFLDMTTTISSNFAIAFMLKYTRYIGFMPEVVEGQIYLDLQLGHTVDIRPTHLHYVDGEDLNIFKNLQLLPYEDISTLQITGAKRREILNHLIQYYSLHMDSFFGLNSPEILNEVMG
jgi:DNA repair protein RecO (recombination protein O)